MMNFIWFRLIVLLLVFIIPILVVIFMAVGDKGDRGKQPRSRRGPMLGIGLAFLVGMVTLVLFFVGGTFLTYREPPQVEWAYPPQSQLTDSEQSHTTAPLMKDMWQRMTESRINLDNEPEVESTEEEKKITRPEWVDHPPKRVGDVYRAVVSSDPFSTVDECFEQLESRFPGEVQKRLAKLVPSDQSSLVSGEAILASGVTLDYIMREVCREQFTEITERDYGAMKQVHVLMEFTPAIETRLLDSWQSHMRRYRLVPVVEIAGCVLAALALLYGMLRFDTWTRGYYTKRLFIGVPAAIIAIIAVVAILGQLPRF